MHTTFSNPDVLSDSDMYFDHLPDKRLAKRGGQLQQSLLDSNQIIIRRIGSSCAMRKGFYRYIHNERVEESALIAAQLSRCSQAVVNKDVLVLQDTSETNFEWNRSRIRSGSGLGVGSNDETLGYFMHPSLVVEADSADVLGLADLHIWARDEDRQRKPKDQRKVAIEDKESYRWIWCAERSQNTLQPAKRITFVQDRDGDQFESFARLPKSNTNLLIRSAINRRLHGQPEKLHEYVAAQQVCLTYKLKIKDNPKRRKRLAVMELKFAKVKIKRPVHLNSFGYPEYVEMFCVLAQEQPQSVPKGEPPIRWVLLTTHPIHNFKEALRFVYWYSLRWLIEEFFRILKKQGFNIESSTLETGTALRKLGIMVMHTATRVLQLKQARDGKSKQPIEAVFDQLEQSCLTDINEQLQGNTEKQKNQYSKKSLAWASWVIARLGGWSPYDKTRPPGVITLTNGMKKFETMFEGWKIANIKKE